MSTEREKDEGWRDELLAQAVSPTSMTSYATGRFVDGVIMYGAFEACKFAVRAYQNFRDSRNSNNDVEHP